MRDAIASHRTEEGDDKVTLVLERPVNASTPLSPQQGGARLESLTEVIKRDLSKPAELGQQQVGPRERVRRLLGEEEDGY